GAGREPGHALCCRTHKLINAKELAPLRGQIAVHVCDMHAQKLLAQFALRTVEQRACCGIVRGACGLWRKLVAEPLAQTPEADRGGSVATEVIAQLRTSREPRGHVA